MSQFVPNPLDTSGVALHPELGTRTTERLAENAHDLWVQQRVADGWTAGDRDEINKRHPSLIPFVELTDQQKERSMTIARETLKSLSLLGFEIVPK